MDRGARVHLEVQDAGSSSDRSTEEIVAGGRHCGRRQRQALVPPVERRGRRQQEAGGQREQPAAGPARRAIEVCPACRKRAIDVSEMSTPLADSSATASMGDPRSAPTSSEPRRRANSPALNASAEPCHSRTLRSPLRGLLTSHTTNQGASTCA